MLPADIWAPQSGSSFWVVVRLLSLDLSYFILCHDIFGDRNLMFIFLPFSQCLTQASARSRHLGTRLEWLVHTHARVCFLVAPRADIHLFSTPNQHPSIRGHSQVHHAQTPMWPIRGRSLCTCESEANGIPLSRKSQHVMWKKKKTLNSLETAGWLQGFKGPPELTLLWLCLGLAPEQYTDCPDQWEEYTVFSRGLEECLYISRQYCYCLQSSSLLFYLWGSLFLDRDLHNTSRKGRHWRAGSSLLLPSQKTI